MARGDVTVRLPTLDEAVPPEARKAILHRLALFGIGRIKRRTKLGLDVDTNAFKPYSADYEEKRRRAGFSTQPDLWLRGGMLGGMTVLDVNPQRALIGFQGTSAKVQFVARTRAPKHKRTGEKADLVAREMGGRIANAAKAYWNNRTRKFFGLTNEDKTSLARDAYQQLLRAIGQASLRRLIDSARKR
jgi:hypothetical protein